MRSARTISTARRSRGGFTLVEMLIVIVIIVILVGLTAAGYFYWAGAQQQRNSEATIRATYKELQRQWNYVVDQAKKEQPSQTVYQVLAGGDVGRARAIWIQVRLMEAFPATYSEITGVDIAGNPDPVNMFLYSNVSLNPKNPLGPAIPAGQCKYLKGYMNALSQAQNPAGTANGVSESAACLLIALGTNRGGKQLDVDALGRFVADSDNDGLKEIVDGFGQPLQLYRFAFGVAPLASGGNTPALKGIQGLNPAAANSKAARLADPLDPDGKLLTWGNNSATFQVVCHPIPTPASSQVSPSAYYVIPVLVSMGPDQQLGLPLPRVASMAGGSPTPLLTATGLTPTNAGEADNTYSFNLKGNP